VIEALEDHFTNTLDLPPAAVDWLLDLWQVIQVFDDAHDGAMDHIRQPRSTRSPGRSPVARIAAAPQPLRRRGRVWRT
jgi:hypothetical protein